MTIADRLAVLDQGAIRQVGTPRELYDAPVDRFVAEFVGSINVYAGRIEFGAAGACAVVVDGLGPHPGERRAIVGKAMDVGTSVSVAFRPHAVRPAGDGTVDGFAFEADVGMTEFLGEFVRHELTVGGMRVIADIPSRAFLRKHIRRGNACASSSRRTRFSCSRTADDDLLGGRRPVRGDPAGTCRSRRRPVRLVVRRAGNARIVLARRRALRRDRARDARERRLRHATLERPQVLRETAAPILVLGARLPRFRAWTNGRRDCGPPRRDSSSSSSPRRYGGGGAGPTPAFSSGSMLASAWGVLLGAQILTLDIGLALFHSLALLAFIGAHRPARRRRRERGR